MREKPYNAPEGFDWITGLEGWRLEGGGLRLSVETERRKRAEVIFEAMTPNVWRMTFLPPGIPRPSSSPMVSGDFGSFLPFKIAEDPNRLLVSGPRLNLEITRRPWSLRFSDPAGREILAENPADVDGLGRLFVLPLGYVQGKDGVKAVSESFRLGPEERLYGLGEKFTSLDKSGGRFMSWNQDALGSTSERSHKNIPFLWSSRGFGIFLDTGARVTWELGTVSCQSWTVVAEDTALQAYIIRGPEPAAILARFTEITGRAPVPPKWTFGLWMSTGGAHRDQASVERLHEGISSYRLPADVIHIDTWWMRRRKYCDFEPDREAFPHFRKLIDKIHSRGLRVSLWEHPYVSVESALFALGRERGYFLKRPDGDVYVIDYGLSLAPAPDGLIRQAAPSEAWNARVATIDLTNPAALAWFKDLHRPILRLGVDAFKTDFGEDVPEDAVSYDGQTGRTLHNLYPLLYNRAVFEVTEEEKGRGFVWSRSGTAGSQRYPTCWSGDPAADFASLAATIRGGLSLGMSGVPFWSHDIGGYRGLPDSELYIRWAQFGLLSSHSRMHGDSPREPWAFGQKALAVVKKFVKLRYALFPYLYSAANEAHLQGLPVLRALPLVFPDDPQASSQDLEFMLGPSLLVAPIFEREPEREVHLPPGRWYDFWGGRAFRGPSQVRVQAPLDTIPIFVRAGAVIPMMKPAERIPEGIIDPLLVHVYPSRNFSARLFEDEGVTEFSGGRTSQTLFLEWSGPAARNLEISVHSFGIPLKGTLIVDGRVRRAVLFRPERGGGLLRIKVPRGLSGKFQTVIKAGRIRGPGSL